MNNESDIKEVRKILKNTKKCDVPENDDDIINWDTNQLAAYIKHKTKGISLSKKLKFAKYITKKIKEEKAKYNSCHF